MKKLKNQLLLVIKKRIWIPTKKLLFLKQRNWFLLKNKEFHKQGQIFCLPCPFNKSQKVSNKVFSSNSRKSNKKY